MTTRWYGVHQPSNMENFAVDSYNLTNKGSWCVKPNSLYTNPKANFGYFGAKCGDPYSYYSFWYRRFPSQNNYLNCYWLPYVDPALRNKFAYIPGSPLCNSIKNYGHNVNDNGFRYYEKKSNINSP